MSWRTHPASQRLRWIGRTLGLNRLAARLRARGVGYEKDLQDAKFGLGAERSTRSWSGAAPGWSSAAR